MTTEIIIRNSARCLSCGDEIESTHRHHMQSCSCGAVAVDGGKAYLRRVFEPSARWEDTSILAEPPATNVQLLESVELLALATPQPSGQCAGTRHERLFR